MPQRISECSSVKPKADASPAVSGKTGTKDKVELSSLSEVERIKARIKEMPSIDEEKVARVKQALDSGTYRTDSKAVARSILRNHLADEID